MLYFTLSEFYFNFSINNFISYYLKEFPKHFKTNINFSAAAGNFPYSTWNGGFNNCSGEGVIYPGIEALLKTTNLLIRLNCSNVLLENFDKFDVMNNKILEIFNNGSSLIEISNLELMEYISNKYPNYQFIFSKEADLINPLDINIINSLIESNKFQLISLPERFNEDIDTLKLISQPSKIEITINPLCNLNCSSLRECAIQEHKNQLEYSSHNTYLECSKRKPYINLIQKDIYDIKKYYGKLGIQNFKLSSCINSSKDEYLLFLISFFIKSEYQYHALTEFCKGVDFL